MPTLKYYDGSDWQYAAIGKIGPTGPTGVTGATGATGPTAGMVLLNTTSFSAVASQALPASSFSATYDSYILYVRITDWTDDSTLYVKLRSGATDSSASYYFGILGFTVAGGANNFTGNPGTAGIPFGELDGGTSSVFWNFAKIEINNPFATEQSQILVQASSLTPGGGVQSLTGAGVHAVATSYDSANVIVTSGTITGSATLFGVNK
jgi:hypothetical protein